MVDPVNTKEKRNALVQQIQEECAAHADNAIVVKSSFGGAVKTLTNSFNGAVMKQCLEAGGLENYMDDLTRKYNSGHGLPPAAAKAASAPVKGK